MGAWNQHPSTLSNPRDLRKKQTYVNVKLLTQFKLHQCSKYAVGIKDEGGLRRDAYLTIKVERYSVFGAL